MEIQGHRGFRGLFPENSLMGFIKAAELGVDALEMDICISEDRMVVVSHEPYMNPSICLTPEGNSIDPDSALDYNLFRMDYKEIREFDCGSRYNPDFPLQKKIAAYKPLLSEVIDSIEKRFNGVRYNIEIKSHPQMDGILTPEPAEYCSLVIEVIQFFDLKDRVNLQSFDLRILEEVHRQDPRMTLALLVDEHEDMDEKLNMMSFRPQIISPHFSLLKKDRTERLKERGYRLIPWTVNALDDMKRMIDLKVDAIITDYPDRLKALIR